MSDQPTLFVPTNWDPALIPEFERFRVDEVYGKFSYDLTGGGRAAYITKPISRKRCAEYIQEIRKRGIRFNYLLNSMCLDNQEQSRSWRKKMFLFLEWLGNRGVDSVTVTIPYLLDVIKRHFPHFKVGIGTGAQVDSAARAKYWEGLGADAITLSEITVNRNFRILRSIRAAVRCKLQLIANNGCLQGCPFAFYHAVCNAHASQSSRKNALFIDYCRLQCRHEVYSDVSNFLKLNWIRPEDIGFYGRLGVDSIKLVDRVMPTAYLRTVLSAYSRQSYEGNLLDILTGMLGTSRYRLGELFSKARFFFHPFQVNVFSFFFAFSKLKNCAVYVDNKGLDGFIENISRINCGDTDCRDCGYCGEIAQKVIRCEDLKKFARSRDNFRAALDGLTGGDFFHYV